MMLQTQIAVVLCVVTFVQAASDNATLDASNPKESIVPLDGFCDPNYFDLSSTSSLSFTEGAWATRSRAPYNVPQLQCQGSNCFNISAQLSSAYCRNTNYGFSNVRWDCRPTFKGSGFTLGSSNVECERGTSFFRTTCVLKNSCVLQYTPTLRTPLVYVLSGLGGFIVLCLAGAGVYFCFCRNNTTTSRTTTTIISSPPVQPYPQAQTYPAAQAYPPAQPYPQTQTYPAAQAYPPAQPYPAAQPYPPVQAAPAAPYPTATAYPTQQHSNPAFGPAPPPYVPQYAPPMPPKEGLY